MSTVKHVASMHAYKNKYDTFTAVIRDEATGDKVVERFATYDEARNYVRTIVWERYGAGRYASMRRGKNEYLANYWIGT